MQYWLFKTEPQVFSIDDLATAAEQTTHWEGIRNYQARNFLRDSVNVGDRVFIYHSSCSNVGIAGVGEVVRAAYPDPFQFDHGSDYYDPKSDPQQPRWVMVDVKFVEKFARVVPLKQIKQMGLKDIALVKGNGRLSIMPVTEAEWRLLYNAAR